MTTREKLIPLQGLRAFAITLVFISHCGFMENSVGGSLFNFAGAAGVSIFLVLAGFLAMYNYRVNESPLTIASLIKRTATKANKFYPLHLIGLVLAVPIMIVAGNYLHLIPKFLTNLFLVQSWIPASSYYFSFNTPSWYLSTYLFLLALSPALLPRIDYLFRSALKPYWAAIGIFVVFVVEVAISALPLSFGFLHWFSYVFPPVRLFDYLAGILLAIFIRSYSNELVALSPALSIGSIVLFGCAILYTMVYPEIQIWYYSAAWLVPSLVIIAACMGAAARRYSFWKWAPLVFLGDISMEFFLIHWLIIRYLENMLDVYSMPIATMLLLFIISLACAWSLSILNKKLDFGLFRKGA